MSAYELGTHIYVDSIYLHESIRPAKGWAEFEIIGTTLRDVVVNIAGHTLKLDRQSLEEKGFADVEGLPRFYTRQLVETMREIIRNREAELEAMGIPQRAPLRAVAGGRR